MNHCPPRPSPVSTGVPFHLAGSWTAHDDGPFGNRRYGLVLRRDCLLGQTAKTGPSRLDRVVAV